NRLAQVDVAEVRNVEAEREKKQRALEPQLGGERPTQEPTADADGGAQRAVDEALVGEAETDAAVGQLALQEQGRLDEEKPFAGPVEEDETEHAPDRFFSKERAHAVAK